MSTETVTVVDIKDEDSRDGSKHWWIVTDANGRKLKVWDKPVADAVKSLAAAGPVEVDVRPASDPKYLPAVVAARPANGGEYAPEPKTPAPPAEDSLVEVMADFMKDAGDAVRRAELRLKSLGLPF